jgi:hypothetical protein
MHSPNDEDKSFSLANISTEWLVFGSIVLVSLCGVVTVMCAAIILFVRAEPDEEVLLVPPTQPFTAVPTTAVDPIATITLAAPSTDGRVTAVNLSSPPTIDGSLAEWSEIPAFTAANIVEQEGSWDGTMDVESRWRVGWDDQNLYLAVAVTDDVHVQIREPKFAYLGDSLELQFDTNIQADYGPGVNNDDYQYIVSPGNFAGLSPGSYRFRGDAQGVMNDFPGSGTRVASIQTAEGYNLEMAIPWSDLGVQPAANLVVGAAFSINDLDTPGTAVQELMLSHIATRRWLDPSSWGSVELQP